MFFLIGIIINFLFMYFYMLIIKFLTPIHIIFSNLISNFFLRIIGYIFYTKENEEITNNYIFIIDYINDIIIFLGLLIYLEFIVLNCCQLSYNLRETIITRSIEDCKIDNNNSNEDTEGGDENSNISNKDN